MNWYRDRNIEADVNIEKTYEFSDYVIHDYISSAGMGLYGITIIKESETDSFAVFGMDQDGGEHEITHLFDLEDIVELLHNK